MDRHGPRFAARHRPVADGADGLRQLLSSRSPLGRDAVRGRSIWGESFNTRSIADRELEIVSEQDNTIGSGDIVSLGDEEETVRVLSQAVLGLWEVVNNLTRLRPTRRPRYRVTIFGSARTDPDHWVYAAVRDLAAELTRAGLRHRHRRRTRADAGGKRGGSDGRGGSRTTFRRHPGRVAVRAGRKPVRRPGFRASHVLLPAAPFRARLGRLRRRAGRDRHGAGDDDDLAASPGAASCTTLRSSWSARCGPKWSSGPGSRCCVPISRWPARRTSTIPICCTDGPEIVEVIRKHHAQWKANQEAAP